MEVLERKKEKQNVGGKLIPRRRAGASKLQPEGSPQQCSAEDKTPGHILYREEDAHYSCPDERWGKEYRQAERVIKASKGPDLGRGQYNIILVPQNLLERTWEL